jgi:hypothetical protein
MALVHRRHGELRLISCSPFTVRHRGTLYREQLRGAGGWQVSKTRTDLTSGSESSTV